MNPADDMADADGPEQQQQQQHEGEETGGIIYKRKGCYSPFRAATAKHVYDISRQEEDWENLYIYVFSTSDI